MNIPSGDATLSQIFEFFELNKHQLGIEDYSVTQTTLDQVFVNFIQAQGDGREPTDGPDDDELLDEEDDTTDTSTMYGDGEWGVRPNRGGKKDVFAVCF